MLRMLKDIKPGNPTIAIRFCLDPGDQAKIAELKDMTVYVFIVIAYENGSEDRQLVPLDQLMTYVGFRYPGKHIVFARLMGQYIKGSLENKLLVKHSYSHYENIVLNYERNDFKQSLEDDFGLKTGCSEIQGDDFEIEMPKEYFAKEPPMWLKRWANLWHKYKSVDQCEFKKRVAIAFSVKWIGVLFFLIFRSVVGVCMYLAGLFLGIRKLDFSPIIHPWKSSLNYIWTRYTRFRTDNYSSHSWIFSDRDGNTRIKTFFVSPPFLTSCWGALYYLSHHFGMTYKEMFMFVMQQIIGLGLIGFAIVTAIAAVVFLIVKAIARYSAYISAYYDSSEYKAKIMAELERRRQETLMLLACPRVDQADQAVNLRAIPLSRRTLKLYFYDTKRKVCKPFAG